MGAGDFALPVIDVGALFSRGAGRERVARQIDAACREQGFFYVTGHGVDEALEQTLERESRRFFSRSEARKREIAMARGGQAWRGFFPVGAELTLGKPDQKEGLYLGTELPPDDPRVVAGLPLHGPNLFPDDMPELRESVLAYLDALHRLADVLMEGIAMGLGLSPGYFHERYTREPLILFRVFRYPALESGGGAAEAWSVGEHTDYGILTILRQTAPGLQVRVGDRWIEAPPKPGSYVCNIGDMLDRMTGGLYRSTPHRVRNESGSDRLSFPFFFDPCFDAEVHPVEGCRRPKDDAPERWDGVSVDDFGRTYGEYLLGKVSKVFPELGQQVRIADSD